MVHWPLWILCFLFSLQTNTQNTFDLKRHGICIPLIPEWVYCFPPVVWPGLCSNAYSSNLKGVCLCCSWLPSVRKDYVTSNGRWICTCTCMYTLHKCITQHTWCNAYTCKYMYIGRLLLFLFPSNQISDTHCIGNVSICPYMYLPYIHVNMLHVTGVFDSNQCQTHFSYIVAFLFLWFRTWNYIGCGSCTGEY